MVKNTMVKNIMVRDGLRWLSSHPSDRKQFVEFHLYCSTPCKITMRVPQISILGPLLFFKYFFFFFFFFFFDFSDLGLETLSVEWNEKSRFLSLCKQRKQSVWPALFIIDARGTMVSDINWVVWWSLCFFLQED